MTKAKAFRELMRTRTLAMPGAFNALTALQIERAGFEAFYLSGASLSAARGLPDIGLLSRAEMVADAKAIADAVSIPALADADTGYGAPVHVMRTVREFEQAGVAGIQLEDQTDPKRCGHLAGKSLIPSAEMARKIAAAVSARRDPDFVIVARTDARAVEGFDGAVARARLYAKAGADALFPEALESADEFKRFARAMADAGVTIPLVANMTEFGKTPYLSLKEFEALGYRIVLFPVTALRVAAKAVEQALRELRASGTQQALLPRMQTRQDLYELIHYADYERRDQELYEKHGRDAED